MSTILALTTEQATEVAAVADAASTDAQRPIINAISLEVVPNPKKDSGEFVLRAVATDSYALAVREIELADDQLLELDRKTRQKPILVNGKQIKAALKAAAQTKSGPKEAVLVELDAKQVTIAERFGDAPEVTLPTVVGTFPKWESLIDSALDRKYDGELPCFDPVKLAKMATYVSTSPSARSKRPFVLHGVGGSPLKPFMFKTSRPGSELRVLLMPVRL